MISFVKENEILLLEYSTDGDIDWINNTFFNNEIISLKNTFKFNKKHLISQSYNTSYFQVAILENDYFKFDREILQLKIDLYIHKDIEIQDKFFFAYYNISIFDKIESLLDISEKEIRIGYSDTDNLHIEDFIDLIKNFPNTTERQHYVNARIDLVLKEYFNTKKNFEKVYNNYMIKKVTSKGENLLDYFKEYENSKYIKILSKLEYMLKNEADYDEKDWQDEILQIFRFIYPKYIRVYDNVTIKNTLTYNNKHLDFLLVDSNGHVDIVEIKKPFTGKNILSLGKYRDNHVPLRELSGSIMQVEKYIYNLNRWGDIGEKKLTKNYESDLPSGLTIKITNPSGIIIMGRELDLNNEQKYDLEIIKRKYKNIIDIITYDDLIRRLKNIIDSEK